MGSLETVSRYHETTKHHPHRPARSLGYLDWATQPDPFRRFRGAPSVSLPLTEDADSTAYDALFGPEADSPKAVCLETVSSFFRHSLALSAWKEHQGSRWALRINPSSGNLHPTEGYLVTGPVEGLVEVPGVFHYDPKDHALERRCEIRPEVWDVLMDGFPRGTWLAGLSSVHWREAWKYGERAYRYCQHDVGHALAALCLAGALHRWQVRPLDGISDRELCGLLGLDRKHDFEHAEREHPALLIAIMPAPASAITDVPSGLPDDAIQSIVRGKWYGIANRLSSDHVEWEWIDSVADACVKSSTARLGASPRTPEFAHTLDSMRPSKPARTIIQQRRSAVAMDGQTSIPSEQFYLMMDRVLPRFERPPWSALGPPAFVHLGLFVHLVEGLAPGLYFLVRSSDRLGELRESMRPEFKWAKPSGCPESLPLYHLMPGDLRSVAGNVSCGQDIAGCGVFSLGMIAAFEGPLQDYGAWIYRRLFWETGMIGQVLYLEAEAAGIRATGIGCFFDDAVHDRFGFTDRKYQSLYHFTVGSPVEDTRLTTLPPYPPQAPTAAGSADHSRT